MEDDNEGQNSSASFIREVATELTARAILPLIIVFLYAVVQLIRGENQDNSFFLLVGSIFSAVTILGYFISMAIREYGAIQKKSFLVAILIYGGLVPWAFGVYIVLINGLWSLVSLANGFSIIVILKSVIFLALGYSLVSNLHKMTELDRGFSDKGKLF